ncbi:hypothetical protein LRAMOSA07970 [Lichtheimia ramosa]|uniref:Uncharacterized protein n=1 Tax=Lichtheimia ramosa TaxID=688394 RepID=A0A077WFN1_9FUNG|nr:hypothetical protein LRAMOSA07970 [Lichtheimia ramosa]
MNHDETTHNGEEEWQDPEQEDIINEDNEEDDWQDTNVIDYWQAAFKGYMSYHKKDADPAILIPAPKRRPKKDDHIKGTKRKWEEDEIEQQQQEEDEEIEQQQPNEEEEANEGVEEAEEQEETTDQHYYNYYYQQYPHASSYQEYTSANVSGQGFAQQPPPPPPPPPFPGNPSFMAAQDNEAFANMIMAWYYSGYYTGYYQARRR